MPEAAISLAPVQENCEPPGAECGAAGSGPPKETSEAVIQELNAPPSPLVLGLADDAGMPAHPAEKDNKTVDPLPLALQEAMVAWEISSIGCAEVLLVQDLIRGNSLPNCFPLYFKGLSMQDGEAGVPLSRPGRAASSSEDDLHLTADAHHFCAPRSAPAVLPTGAPASFFLITCFLMLHASCSNLAVYDSGSRLCKDFPGIVLARHVAVVLQSTLRQRALGPPPALVARITALRRSGWPLNGRRSPWQQVRIAPRVPAWQFNTPAGIAH